MPSVPVDRVQDKSDDAAHWGTENNHISAPIVPNVCFFSFFFF